MDIDPAEALLGQLTAARSAAEQFTGIAPLGIRAVEIATGERAYLCAYDGPAFLCLGAELRPENSARRVEQVATASLVWEQLEAMLDADRLRDLAAAAARVLAIAREPVAMTDAVQSVAETVLVLAEWRDEPQRALASLPEIDIVSGRHERVFRAYERFVASTEGLVAAQDSLDPDLVAALRGFEEAAGRASVGERLAPRLGPVIEACHGASEEITSSHLVPLV
jgi:hypothetical protein